MAKEKPRTKRPSVTSREQLQRLLIEGIRSGEPILADAKFWMDKRRKVSGTI